MKMKNAFSNEMCAKMLLNSIGASNFSLLSSLAAPKLPSEITYNEIVALLSKHLSPKKNMVVKQHAFPFVFAIKTAINLRLCSKSEKIDFTLRI